MYLLRRTPAWTEVPRMTAVALQSCQHELNHLGVHKACAEVPGMTAVAL